MNRSRLYRKIERQSKKNLLFSLLGIIVVLFIFVKFGIPLLVNFSLFIGGGDEKKEVRNEIGFVPPPMLNPLPSATSSAKIFISGFASPKQDIELFINNDLIDKTPVKEDGTFSFLEEVATGQNSIKAKAVMGDKESEFSKPISVAYINKPPSLNLTAPISEQTFSKEQNTVNIEGTTDSGVKVTINGFRAITDEAGNFSYNLTLQNGGNTIKILAQDEAGNKSEKEIKVTYNP